MNDHKLIEDELSPILFDILHYMMQRTQGWQALHANQDSNRIAHDLAKFAFRRTCERVWTVECPP